MSVLVVYYLVIRIRDRTWWRKNERYVNRNTNRNRKKDIHMKNEKYGNRNRNRNRNRKKIKKRMKNEKYGKD